MADQTPYPFDAASGGPTPPPTAKADLVDQIGYSGTNLYAGLLSQEYLPALRGQAAYTVYDQMRRSEGQVAATLAVWELPIRAAQWYVEAADPDDPKSVEQADFVNYNLFEYGAQSFDGFLCECCTMFAFGFSVFEKVFAYMSGAEHDGKLGLRKLAFRDQKSIFRWLVEQGDLAGVVQLGAPYWRQVTIPADKLAVFTHRREGSNFEGISLLRPAYKHWLIKDNLYRLQSVVLERNGMGIIVARWKDNLQPQQIAKIKEMVERARVNESVAFTIPMEGVELSILQANGLGPGIAAFQTAIEHHDLKIAGSALAGFLNLAGGQNGSYALSADHSELLMYALSAAADYIADTLNQQVIPQLVSLNFGEQARYPKLRHSKIGGAHLASLGITMKGLAEAGLISADLPTENALRNELGLPERTEEQVAAEEEAAFQKQRRMQEAMAAAAAPEQPATDNGGDEAGGGDGSAPEKPLEQGKLRRLTEQYGRTLAEVSAATVAATRRLGEQGQRTGETPSAYLARSRRRAWPGAAAG